MGRNHKHERVPKGTYIIKGQRTPKETLVDGEGKRIKPELPPNRGGYATGPSKPNPLDPKSWVTISGCKPDDDRPTDEQLAELEDRAEYARILFGTMGRKR